MFFRRPLKNDRNLIMNKNWSKTTLGSLGKISMCKRILKEETSESGDIPFYKISTFGGIADAFISKDIFEKYRETYSYPKIGDILISAAGTLGKTVIFDGKPSYFQDSNIVWVDNDEKTVINSFLYYFYQTNPWIKTTGSTINRLYNNDIKNLEISFPNLIKQQSIASVLSALDKKIALNKQINACLEEMAKTLYDYWFVQFDFPDANGKPYKSSGGEMVFDETLKREIPKGWEVKSLNQVADIVMGQSPDGTSYNLEQEGTIFFQGSTDFDWRFPNVRQYTTSPTRFAQKGDILLSVRAPVGDLNISPFECCIGRGLAALRSKSGNNSFLFYVMKYFKTVFERRNTEGTTFGSITKDDLHSLKLVAPADNVLEKYNEIASKYDEMIFIRSQQNHQLTQLRDFLLPMLMNGQVSVAE